MKFAIIVLMLPLLLVGCGGGHSNARLIMPDVVSYPQSVMTRAADEIDGGSCPVLSDVMMPDYGVMRDQARAGAGRKVDIGR